MKIRLYNYAVIASGLSWKQVNEAAQLANASESGKHFRYYFHAFDDAPEPVNRWSLMAMPIIYHEMLMGADDSGWWIDIPDES